jgi:hypothetical protein
MLTILKGIVLKVYLGYTILNSMYKLNLPREEENAV